MMACVFSQKDLPFQIPSKFLWSSNKKSNHCNPWDSRPCTAQTLCSPVGLPPTPIQFHTTFTMSLNCTVPCPSLWYSQPAHTGSPGHWSPHPGSGPVGSAQGPGQWPDVVSVPRLTGSPSPLFLRKPEQVPLETQQVRKHPSQLGRTSFLPPPTPSASVSQSRGSRAWQGGSWGGE